MSEINASVLSCSDRYRPKYQVPSFTKNTVNNQDAIIEDRNPSEDTSNYIGISSDRSSYDKSRSESNALSSSSSSSSLSQNGEGSVLSATSAVITMDPKTEIHLDTDSLDESNIEMNRGSSYISSKSRQNSPSLQSALEVNGNFTQKMSPGEIKKFTANLPSVGMQRVGSKTASFLPPMYSTNSNNDKNSVTEVKRTPSQQSPIRSNMKPQTPSAPDQFPKAQVLYQRTIDLQDMYALGMAGTSNSGEEALLEKFLEAKHERSRHQCFSNDASTTKSIDSQEQYALRMTYGERSQRLEEKQWNKTALANQKAKEQKQAAAKKKAQEALLVAEKAAAERAAALRARLAAEKAYKDKETADRLETEKLVAERDVAKKEVNKSAAKTIAAKMAAQDEMRKKIEEQKQIEAKAEALEIEAEVARAKSRDVPAGQKTRPFFSTSNDINTKAKITKKESICNDEYSDSDYSSDSDEGETLGLDNGDDESSQDGSEGTKESKMKELILKNVDDQSIKSDVSSMSSSASESEDEKEANDRFFGRKKNNNIFSNKRQVVMMSKGLKKGAKKEKTDKIVTTKNKSRTGRKTTSKKMKKTTFRSRKTKIKKKTCSQMITIRQNGKREVEEIIPVTKDKNAKVMRVCKLTSKGYISAEFSSVDPRNTPLHIACLTHYPEKFILDHLMKSDKKSENFKPASKENSSGELPIHYAVMDRKGVPPIILEALIKEFPESIQHANIDGSLPLHVACEVGAPSLYSIKRLCAQWPESVMIQNELRVSLFDEEEEIQRMLESQNSLACCYNNFGIDWFGVNEGVEIENFETGWSALHLASMNGAEPEVIETLLEADSRCLTLKTNKGRSPLECAKWCVINAIINDISVTKLQNTFASIQIMQSYNQELKVKDELTQKVGLINAAVENVNSYGGLWKKSLEMMPKKKNAHRESKSAESIGDGEVGMTELHRVILSRNPPDEVQAILERSPDTMMTPSTHDRTPLECAKQIIIKGLLLGEYVSTLTNTFVSLEIMQAFDEFRDQDAELDASQALSKSVAKKFKDMTEVRWGSSADNFNYTKEYVEIQDSALGRFVKNDNDSAMQPHEYYPPENLSHVNLRINIPVGFRRFRRAFLNSKETFLSETVLGDGLGYKDIKIIPWNKHKKAIGMPKLKHGEEWEDFIGALRTLSYWVPKTEAGGEHMAYETMEIIDYNDFCFTVKSIIKAPDLPYGSEYETHHQMIVHDKGINNVRLICSSEVKFTGMMLDDKWEVRNSMRHYTTDYFYALADAICLHSG